MNKDFKIIEIDENYIIAIDQINKVLEIYYNHLLIHRLEYGI